MEHLITDIQRFSLNDGPGIRTTVFFKGCNMHCAWCHNPETLSPKAQLMFYPAKCIGCGKCFAACPAGAHTLSDGKHTINRSLCTICGKCAQVCYAQALVISGKEMSVAQIMDEVRQDKAYYEASGGGVTLSGGEVLCHTEFALALTKACHAEGISVALETNLSFPYDAIRPLLEEVDLIMADCKLFDDALHRQYTGISNRTVLENLRAVQSTPIIVRTPLIPGVTATAENLRGIATFLSGKENLIYYQLLNFNPLGDTKYRSLDTRNPFAEATPYTQAQMEGFGKLLSDIPIALKVGE